MTSPWGLCLAMKIKNAIIVITDHQRHHNDHPRNRHLGLQEVGYRRRYIVCIDRTQIDREIDGKNTDKEQERQRERREKKRRWREQLQRKDGKSAKARNRQRVSEQRQSK